MVSSAGCYPAAFRLMQVRLLSGALKGPFVYRSEDASFSSWKDGFDSHTGYSAKWWNPGFPPRLLRLIPWSSGDDSWPTSRQRWFESIRDHWSGLLVQENDAGPARRK